MQNSDKLTDEVMPDKIYKLSQLEGKLSDLEVFYLKAPKDERNKFINDTSDLLNSLKNEKLNFKDKEKVTMVVKILRRLRELK